MKIKKITSKINNIALNLKNTFDLIIIMKNTNTQIDISDNSSY